MAENSFQEKTEKATPRRRKEAREKGQVAKSVEVSSVLILLSILGVFSLSGSWLFLKFEFLMHQILGHLGDYTFNDTESVRSFLVMMFNSTFLILFPFFLTIIVFGLAGNVIQVGFSFSSKALSPNFSKLNPISGIKRMVSLRSFVELAKSIIKIIIVGTAAYLTVKKEITAIPGLINMDVNEILIFICKTSLKLGFVAGLCMLFLAVLDFTYQKFQNEKELKMTLQEVKEESRQTEGDPKIKARIRSVQMEMMRRRMIQAVPQATVVITNPTHLAVALKFEYGKMFAPQVVAKGAGVIAAQIRKLAKENNVPVIENKPLARAMFKTVEVGDFIPVELYQAVAEILAYIYRLKGKS